MRPHPDQLAALVAIVERGTFEAAARQLHVTPSAVSQRIRGLESMAGQVLVRRSSPCAATPAGERLLRLARQTNLLYDEAADALDAAARGPIELPVDAIHYARVEPSSAYTRYDQRQAIAWLQTLTTHRLLPLLAVEQIDGRLRSHFPEAFIDSLYPELRKGGATIAGDEVEDEEPSAPPAVPPQPA